MTISDVKRKALALLARREHSHLELRNKLMEFCKGDTTGIETVLEELTRANVQSDARYTESYVTARVIKGYGPSRIRAELQQRGIAEYLIDEALSHLKHDWDAIIKKVHQKKFGQSQPVDFNTRVKQIRFLEYRGFTQDHIRTLLEDC